jgi:hypothetical protein
MAEPVEPTGDLFQNLQELETIFIVQEHVLPCVPTACYVVDCAWVFNAKGPCHNASLA